MELNRYKDISEHWLKYQDALRNYIFRFVKNADTANHLSHEVLMKVYASCCSGRDIKNIRSWLFQICYTTCMDHFKQENKTTEIKSDFKAIEEDLTYEETAELMSSLINLLPLKYSKPLELSDIQGLKQEEVANLLGLSLTATKTRIQRARQKLKEQILECGNVEINDKGNLTGFQLKSGCKPLQKSGK
ncbi:sigma-70 family RNA polymerase sigma factor [Gramella sp. GC03-9]|uniref:Sigma-70 family RNA polymerase sigma factor n=1 Tax=Christiangramia oceanisediminis TaxID=2920386 RepID=A0A9X2KW90_9FLAO|nr:sigma-70 family RNA polymerase sigma factor [Gramella oceanisediminis]MCP9199590.1 sigma-70 family RNA polymerase sigma factor [Gramella oceanisediminis]